MTKNIEHHIERHYEIESNKNYILQQIEVEEEFYEDRLNHCLRISDSSEFIETILDHYGEHEAIDDFDYLKDRSFKDFFRTNLIDTPRCFRKTKSVRRPLNQINLLKLNNYLMRDGKRTKLFKFLSKSIWTLIHEPNDDTSRLFKTNLNWHTLFITFNYLSYTTVNKHWILPSIKEEPTSFGHTMIPVGKNIEDDWNMNTFLFKNLYQILPLFSFYIYKVDKKIFKNTRGRSGKFTFIWKYVAPYKRLFLSMHWLMKELRIKPGRTLDDRLTSTLRTLVLTPQKTWIWRVKKFSHNYVYRNSRKTLAENYRTVTR